MASQNRSQGYPLYVYPPLVTLAACVIYARNARMCRDQGWVEVAKIGLQPKLIQLSLNVQPELNTEVGAGVPVLFKILPLSNIKRFTKDV
eukprot:scaffold64136_cov39-Prasinocladus_malaysianus.AAC.2